MKVERRVFVATLRYKDGSTDEVVVHGIGTIVRAMKDAVRWSWQQGKPGRCISIRLMGPKEQREEGLA